MRKRAQKVAISDVEKSLIKRLVSQGRTMETVGNMVGRKSGVVCRAFYSEPRAGAKKRALPAPVAARRALVVKLAQRVRKVDGVCEPVFASAKEIGNELFHKHNIDVVPQTVRNDLHAMRFKAFVRPKVTALPQDTQARLDFASENVDRNPEDLVFVDETIIDTNTKHKRRHWSRSRKNVGTRRNARWPAGRAHCFAGIGVGVRFLLVLPEFEPRERDPDTGRLLPKRSFKLNAASYTAMCLGFALSRQPALGWTQARRGARRKAATKMLVQDGAACHTSQVSASFYAEKGIRVLPRWPARSPDLNPIETCFANLKRRVSARHPKDRATLVKAILDTWNLGTPQNEVDKLVRSFPARCRKVVANRGEMR